MKKILIVIIFLFLLSRTVYGAINYQEYFPNNINNIFQSLQNGWTSWLNNVRKEIMTPEGCIAVNSALSQSIFIPTRTQGEWKSFKNSNIQGITLNSCTINGQCGTDHGKILNSQPSHTCTTGTLTNLQSTLGGWTWNCSGEGGGNHVQCAASKGGYSWNTCVGPQCNNTGNPFTNPTPPSNPSIPNNRNNPSGQQLSCTEIGQNTFLRFNGNVDHTIRITMQIFSENGQGFHTIGGSEILKQQAQQVGGVYEESNEGLHGDLSAHVTYSPLSRHQIEGNNFQTGTLSFINKNSRGFWRMQVTIIQQPSRDNNWIGIMDVYTPASGEQHLDATLFFTPHCQ